VSYAQPALGAGMAGLGGSPGSLGTVLAVGAYLPGKSAWRYEVVGATRISNFVDSQSVVPIFNARGPFDVYVYKGPPATAKKLSAVITAASEVAVWPHGWCAGRMTEQEHRRVLALPTPPTTQSPSSQWVQLIPDMVGQQVRDRLGIARPVQAKFQQ